MGNCSDKIQLSKNVYQSECNEKEQTNNSRYQNHSVVDDLRETDYIPLPITTFENNPELNLSISGLDLASLQPMLAREELTEQNSLDVCGDRRSFTSELSDSLNLTIPLSKICEENLSETSSQIAKPNEAELIGLSNKDKVQSILQNNVLENLSIFRENELSTDKQNLSQISSDKINLAKKDLRSFDIDSLSDESLVVFSGSDDSLDVKSNGRTLEYTFYVHKTVKNLKPFIDGKIRTFVKACKCKLVTSEKLLESPATMYRGQHVFLVTIKSPDLTNLKLCISCIDTQYPEFNAGAFLPANI